MESLSPQFDKCVAQFWFTNFRGRVLPKYQRGVAQMYCLDFRVVSPKLLPKVFPSSLPTKCPKGAQIEDECFVYGEQ